MRNIKGYTTILALVLLILGPVMMYAQSSLPAAGIWGIYKDVVDAEGEITLTGNIDMVGVIRIPVGKTFKITNTPGKNITIRNTGIGQVSEIPGFSSGRSRMFTVKGNGGKLIIEAAEGTTITIDGGANFSWDPNTYKLSPGSNSRELSEAIENEGTLELNGVVIQNVNGSDANGGAIDVHSSADGPTTLINCKIEKCYSQLGSAIMIQGEKKVTITDSEINYCHSGGGYTDNSGGAIRTYGNVVASLYLTRVKFTYNYAQRNEGYDNTLEKDGNGGALFWNARGTNDTKCVIDGCEFAYNKSDDNGGAIKTQATLVFQGSTTSIHHNSAPVGAGLYIEGYTGGSNVTGERTINYDLNTFMHIYDNIAPYYTFDGENIPGRGAGVHLWFGPKMTLEANSTINLNMNGALIENNKSNGDTSTGGGIFFENTSLSEKNYTFNINLNYGTIKNNSAVYGGGMYVSKGEVGSTPSGSNTLALTGNTAGTSGGGIYVKDGSLEMANGTISSNTISGSGNGGGIFIENGNFTIKDGEVSGNNISSGMGAGAYIVGSNGKGNFIMYGGKIQNNTTSGNNGGGVYINGGNFTLDNQQGKITGNKAIDGGGVYLNNGNFALRNGTISENASSGKGGGVFLVGEDCVYKLTDGNIKNNVAKTGGGVYLETGSFILGESKDDTGNISGNAATENGGGVYIASGGGFTMNGGTIENNGTYGTSSTKNGGGVFLDGGDLNVVEGKINGNNATEDGGGVYIQNGNVQMGDGYLSNNTCGMYGGGVYVHNSSDIEKVVTFSGGTLQGNRAKYGGGICMDGKIELTIGDVEIAENTATNGGGVCLMNNAVMTFGVGQIKNNHAVKSSGSETYTGKTGYQKDITELEGIGGGIYLNSSTKLIFNAAEQLGLFGNTADNGADEIFANGNNTILNLPDVSSMTEGLGGYPGAGNLKWIEDYPTNDTSYGSGTKLLGSNWNNSNLRYRAMLAQNFQNLPYLQGGISENGENAGKYICFALGYEIIYITLTREGLQKGESAVYTFEKDGANTFRVIVTGDGNQSVTKKIAVTAGTWKVSETGWSWSYGENNRVLEQDVTEDGDNRKFIFNIAKKGELPMHKEHILLNEMGN